MRNASRHGVWIFLVLSPGCATNTLQVPSNHENLVLHATWREAEKFYHAHQEILEHGDKEDTSSLYVSWEKLFEQDTLTALRERAQTADQKNEREHAGVLYRYLLKHRIQRAMTLQENNAPPCATMEDQQARLREFAQHLHANSYAQLWAEAHGLDVFAIRTLAEDFLQQTEVLWRTVREQALSSASTAVSSPQEIQNSVTSLRASLGLEEIASHTVLFSDAIHSDPAVEGALSLWLQTMATQSRWLVSRGMAKNEAHTFAFRYALERLHAWRREAAQVLAALEIHSHKQPPATSTWQAVLERAVGTQEIAMQSNAGEPSSTNIDDFCHSDPLAGVHLLRALTLSGLWQSRWGFRPSKNMSKVVQRIQRAIPVHSYETWVEHSKKALASKHGAQATYGLMTPLAVTLLAMQR